MCVYCTEAPACDHERDSCAARRGGEHLPPKDLTLWRASFGRRMHQGRRDLTRVWARRTRSGTTHSSDHQLRSLRVARPAASWRTPFRACPRAACGHVGDDQGWLGEAHMIAAISAKSTERTRGGCP